LWNVFPSRAIHCHQQIEILSDRITQWRCPTDDVLLRLAGKCEAAAECFRQLGKVPRNIGSDITLIARKVHSKTKSQRFADRYLIARSGDIDVEQRRSRSILNFD